MFWTNQWKILEQIPTFHCTLHVGLFSQLWTPLALLHLHRCAEHAPDSKEEYKKVLFSVQVAIAHRFPTNRSHPFFQHQDGICTNMIIESTSNWELWCDLWLFACELWVILSCYDQTQLTPSRTVTGVCPPTTQWAAVSWKGFGHIPYIFEAWDLFVITIWKFSWQTRHRPHACRWWESTHRGSWVLLELSSILRKRCKNQEGEEMWNCFCGIRIGI